MLISSTPEKNSYKVHKSQFFTDRATYILKQCKGKKVLHIGPCNWPYTKETFGKGELLYEQIDAVASEQLGIDLDQPSIDIINDESLQNSRTMYQDMNKELETDFSPEVIVFGETMEHLMNQETALSSMKKIMTPETMLIISVPNAFEYKNILRAFRGVEKLHPDHSAAFTYGTLSQLLGKMGLTITDFHFTFLQKKSSKNWKGKLVHYVCSKKPLISETLLVTCKKND